MATYDELGIEVKGSRGTQKVKCPACSHTRKHKTDKPLSVNLNTGLYNCHNCGWSGIVNGKTEEQTQQERRQYVQERRQYAKPVPVALPLEERTMAWFDKRGIERRTLQYFKVSESCEWMPERDGHPAGSRTCINFNYYRGEEKVNVKYRDALKCFRMTKDAELILYNLNALSERTDMLICEGEIDCMSFYQSGHYSAVSVPNGASKGSARLDYLDTCGEVFERMTKIIIAVDGDEAGTCLRNELTRRLGSHRCWFVEYPSGCKDANEVLLTYGLEAVRSLWESAVAPPLEAVLTVEDLEAELNHIYLNGWPTIKPIGYAGFDKLLNFAPGETTVVTGIPQHGKDEFITQVLLRKASRYGEKSALFNYEETATAQIVKCAQKYIGRPFYRQDRAEMMNPAQKDAAFKFISRHFFFIDVDRADLTIDGLLAKGAELVLRKDIKYYVIGPYSCIEGGRESWQTEGEYISQVWQKINHFSRKYRVHVFLVAHPVKMSKDKTTGKFEVPNLYSISGSQHFFSKPQNGMTIYRNYDDNTTDVHVQKVKYFFNGEQGMQTFNFDKSTGRYAEVGMPFESELDHQRQQQTQMEVDLPETTEPSAEVHLSDEESTSTSLAIPNPVQNPAVTGPTNGTLPSVKTDLSDWSGPMPETDLPF